MLLLQVFKSNNKNMNYFNNNYFCTKFAISSSDIDNLV